MITIRPLHTIAQQPLAALVLLLQDSVHGGASVGFLAPLTHQEAHDYWQGVAAALGPLLHCWVAEDQSRIIGTVQLALCGKANGRHRGEIQKLMVHSRARGLGIACLLMQEAETAAWAAGCSTLVLDTDSTSVAASLYPKLGWVHAGDIPAYAASPDGSLHTTRNFYKLQGTQ
ncbi:GNAT family N-acetyltransferase [Vogesella sp. DC21W]|uniref:GNAT family N-acetyltransferase n=1 Tax=Vogesella aquatica TaxID=2984206 RepID=A0ABT5IXS5_9NEIS|nr:GNAT family N-acetyltransferase [Vogesella aquatica]MDC7717368.1 GNAT family N-acetyltransferase [Vogesella aquatica]